MRNYLYGLATDKYNGLPAFLAKFFLWALSLLYGAIIRCLMFIYSLGQYRAPCRIISVGNITLGGTGKTPVVEYIARRLKERGCKSAVLTRGYRPKGADECRSNAGCPADEPDMLRKSLKDIPVVIDAQRIRGIKYCRDNFGADTVILDDGFQQWKIHKDLEVVVIDAVNPFGNRHMLPRGILRQPLSSLKRADVFLLTKTDINPRTSRISDLLSRLNPKAVIAESVHKPVGFSVLGKSGGFLDMNALKGVKAALVSGIGDPEYFEKTAKGLGVEAVLSFRFPDHYRYSPADLEAISGQLKNKGINTIVTTEKDAVRLARYYDQEDFAWLKFLALRVELTFTKNEQGFLSRLF